MPDRLEFQRTGNMNAALGAIALDTKHAAPPADVDVKEDESVASDQKRKLLEVKFATVAGTLDDQFLKDFPCYMDGLVASSPGRYVTLPEYPKKAETVYNLIPRSDDVYILTFPKCGTTWMQELVWLVINQCDFEKAKTPLNIRSPFLE